MISTNRPQRHPFLPLGLLIVAVTVAAVVAWLAQPSGESRRAKLADVEQWTYQLQDFANSRRRIARSDSDMLVIDYAADGDDDEHDSGKGGEVGGGLKPLKRATVEKLKRKPDASRRLVIAYFSVGEAEEYRPYWRQSWRDDPPPWIIAENCRWPKNHLVKFWERGWRDIVFAGANSYLEAIQDAGFDGVYLDRVDVYADIADRFPQARERMISFVQDLASAARARDPGFLVIAQNAEELLDDNGYRATIDAVAKEDLLYGVDKSGQRNANDMVEDTTRLLDLLKDDGKPVFAIEYLTSADAIEKARSELEELGYVGVFPTRALDGTDPVAGATKEPAQATSKAEHNDWDAPETQAHETGTPETGTPETGTHETGTPEYAVANNCDGVWKRVSSHSTGENR